MNNDEETRDGIAYQVAGEHAQDGEESTNQVTDAAFSLGVEEEVTLSQFSAFGTPITVGIVKAFQENACRTSQGRIRGHYKKWLADYCANVHKLTLPNKSSVALTR